jgi:plastocyanin
MLFSKRHLAAALAAAVFAAAFALPALGGNKKQPVAAGRVQVRDNFFSPRSVTVQEGETVKWTWKSDNRHNVTFTRVPKGAGRRGSKTRRHGRWYRTFRKPGQYRYVCTLFAGMRGSVAVEPAGESTLGATQPSPTPPVPMDSADLAAGARP